MKITNPIIPGFHPNPNIYRVGQAYSFYFATTPAAWQPLAQNIAGRILSTPVAGGFVGAYVGLYASSNDQASDNMADFD